MVHRITNQVLCLVMLSAFLCQAMEEANLARITIPSNLYNPVPIFHLWTLSQISELHKNVRFDIMEQYMKKKEQQSRHLYENMLRMIDISLADLMLLPDKHTENIQLLNSVCFYAWNPRCYYYKSLSAQEYKDISGLPQILKKKFAVVGKTVKASVYEPHVLIDFMGSSKDMEIILDETVKEELSSEEKPD